MQTTRLLCIDDDPFALDHVRLLLQQCDLPLQVEFFGSPAQALAAHRHKPAELVLSDLRMGASTGIDLIATMREFAEDSIYMLLSGEADLNSALKAMNEAGVFRFFTKPTSVETIKLGLSEALCEYDRCTKRRIADSALDAMEKMNAAIACVDVSGKLFFANKPAEHIFRHSGYFCLSRNNEVRSIDSNQTELFLEFLRDALQCDEATASKGVFRFTHPGHHQPIVISAVRDGQSENRLSLLIADPRRPVASPRAIGAALNLTPSESRVVHGLVSGGSVDEAAALAGVSVSSARTYLKNVFAKTGVSRQAELVRLAIMTAA